MIINILNNKIEVEQVREIKKINRNNKIKNIRNKITEDEIKKTLEEYYKIENFF